MKALLLISSLFLATTAFAEQTAYVQQVVDEGIVLEEIVIIKAGNTCRSYSESIFGSQVNISTCYLDNTQFRVIERSASFCDEEVNKLEEIVVDNAPIIFDAKRVNATKYDLKLRGPQDLPTDTVLIKIPLSKAQKKVKELGCK